MSAWPGPGLYRTADVVRQSPSSSRASCCCNLSTNQPLHTDISLGGGVVMQADFDVVTIPVLKLE
jgi:hypothetical protein